MTDFKSEWTELEVCRILNLTPSDLRLDVMEGVVDAPRISFTGELIYSQEQVDRLCQYHLRTEAQQRIEELRRRWDQDLNNKEIQEQVLQLVAFQRLFRHGDWQGLQELWEHDSLTCETIHFIIDELRRAPVEEALFREMICLLYAKVVPLEYKGDASQRLWDRIRGHPGTGPGH